MVNRNEIACFVAFKRTNKTGTTYSGKEKIYGTGCLLFQNVTQKDAGAYMLRMVIGNLEVRDASVQFHVHTKQFSVTSGGGSHAVCLGKGACMFCSWSSLEGKALWRIPSICQGPMQTLLQTSVLILGAHGLQASLTFAMLILTVTLRSSLLVVIVPEFIGNKRLNRKIKFL